MRVDRINYQKTFNLGNYTSERIGMEAELEGGESAQDQLLILKAAVEKLHKDSNPQLDFGLTDASSMTWEDTGIKNSLTMSKDRVVSFTQIPTIDPRAQETAEIGIDNATTIKDLEFYADIAVKYGLVEMYLNKKKTLK